MQHYQCIFKVEGQFKKKEGRRVSGSSPSKGYGGSKWQKVDGSTSEVECNLASCSLQMKRLYMLSVLMAIHLIYTSFIHTLWYTTLCRWDIYLDQINFSGMLLKLKLIYLFMVYWPGWFVVWKGFREDWSLGLFLT